MSPRVEPGAAFLTRIAVLLPAFRDADGGPIVQKVLQHPRQRVAVTPALGIHAVGQLPLVAVGQAKRFLDGVDAVVDQRLVGGEPVEHLSRRRRCVFRGPCSCRDRRPSRRDSCSSRFCTSTNSFWSWFCLSSAVVTARIPPLISDSPPSSSRMAASHRVSGDSHVLPHDFRFEECLAGAAPFLRIFRGSLRRRRCPTCPDSGSDRRW